MKELIWVRVQYASRQQCCKTHKRPLPFRKCLHFIRQLWKNMIEPDRRQATIWIVCIVCWIPKAKDTHSEYAILIAFPCHQWLHESASLLRYTYIACLVIIESERVYCAVRSECLNVFRLILVFKSLSSTRFSCLRDKRAKTGYLPKSNALSNIGKQWTEKHCYFSILFK